MFCLRCFVFSAALLLDRVTKYWAQLYLSGHSPGSQIKFLSLRLYFNSGISFSLLERPPWISLFVSLTGIGVLILLCIRSRSVRSMIETAFLLAGATGNLMDRVMYGYVVDWIYVGKFINLADIWLGCGGFLILMRYTQRFQKKVL
jgi:signal peptidase II